MNGQIRAIRIQDSAPPGLQAQFRTKMRCSKQNDIIYRTKRLAQLEHNNRGKKPEMRPKQCVFASRNGRKIMECYNHLFVDYATPKKNAENPVFIRLLGKNLRSLIFSRVFCILLQQDKNPPCDRNSYKTLDLRMNLYSWYPERQIQSHSGHKSGQIAMSRHSNSHILPTTDKSNERLLRLVTG